MSSVEKVTTRTPSGHGAGLRGDSTVARSSVHAGRFGRLFRSLPAADWPQEALDALAAKMTAEPEKDEDSGLPSAAPETDEAIQDDEENTGISAGYTYLGQFIDHDITFDPMSSLMKLNDLNALVDFRTPALDLDSLYGRGPDDQPYMYEADGKKFRLGKLLTEGGSSSRARDVPRFDDPCSSGPKRALIGDKRNDENVIVSQLQSAMLQLHNRFVDEDPSAPFATIQRRVRFHYQWVVVNDFLMKICGEETVREILPHLGAKQPIWKHPPNFSFYKFHEDAFMPIEFSAAAYRFGHSMVRPIYRLNTVLQGGQDPNEANPDEMRRGLAGRFFIFAGVQKRGLNGFDEFPTEWGIDWSLFFDINGSADKRGPNRRQPAYKIDTSLVNPLGFLPEFSEPPLPAGEPMDIPALQSVQDPQKGPSNLALRNLFRGKSLALPSGQSVAMAMGIDPIDEEDLRVGKAVVNDFNKSPTLESLHESFKGNAPLWYYVLAEAQHEWFKRATATDGKGDREPVRLGAVGGRIVAETIIGLLWADGSSYLRQAPNWQPEGIKSMGDLLKRALDL